MVVLAILGELLAPLIEILLALIAAGFAYVCGGAAWELWSRTRHQVADTQQGRLPLSRRLFASPGEVLQPARLLDRFDLVTIIVAPLLLLLVVVAVLVFLVELLAVTLAGFAILGFREVSRRWKP